MISRVTPDPDFENDTTAAPTTSVDEWLKSLQHVAWRNGFLWGIGIGLTATILGQWMRSRGMLP